MSRSSFYYESIKKDDIRIVKRIEKYLLLMPESGYRQVTDHLKKRERINRKRVYRIMKENGLLCRKSNKTRVKTTNSKHGYKKYPNLTKDLTADKKNQVLVGDVTAYDVKGRDHYLALLMDLYTREIIGYAISDRNDTALVLSALETAKRKRRSLKGCIHHTDSDVRYCSHDYIAKLKEYEMEISMCRGNVYENAHAESLNKTIKRQEINISDYDSKDQSAVSIFSFIKKYNTIRPHSSLAGLTPMDFINTLFTGKNIYKNKKRCVQF